MRASCVVPCLLLTACGATAVPRQQPCPAPNSVPVSAASSAVAAPPQRFVNPAQSVARFEDPERKAKLLAAAPKLDAHFAEFARTKHIPGLAVGLVVDGELVWSNGYGVRDVTSKQPVDADTLFRLASVTKSFTAMAVLELRDEGKLSLDEPAEKYVPELAGIVYPTRDAPRITLRQLLTHDAGLPHDAPISEDAAHPPTEAAVLASLQGMTLERPTNVAYSYSNLGFYLAGVAVSRVSGLPYADFLASHVLRPLGMTSTGFNPPAGRLADGYLLHGETVEHPPMIHLGAYPAGGLFSSVRDMARYVAFQLAAWPPRDDADDGPLRRSSVREAQRTATFINMYVPHRALGKEQRALTDGYGFGWVAEQTCDFDQIVWHNGALTDGYRSMVMLLPERGVGIVALANLFDEDMNLEGTVTDAARILDSTGALAKRVLPVSPQAVAARDAVLSLRVRWDDQAAERLFTEGNKELVTALKKAIPDDLRDHGTCRVTSTSMDGPFDLKWETVCDHGGHSWELWLDAKTGRIAALRGDDRFPPDPRLAKAAPALAGLVAQWDDHVFDARLAAPLERAKVKAVFAAAAEAHGSCKVDHADDRGDKTHARFVLACKKGGPLEMRTVLDDKSGKVTEVTLGRPVVEGARCP